MDEDSKTIGGSKMAGRAEIDEAKDKELTKILEPADTPLGEFQRVRTEAISEMFDNADKFSLYPTTKFFVRLDDCVRKLLQAERERLHMSR